MDLSNMSPLFPLIHTQQYDNDFLNTVIKNDVYVNGSYNKTLQKAHPKPSIEPPLPAAPFSAVIDAFIEKHNDTKQNTTSIAATQQMERKNKPSIQADVITIPAPLCSSRTCLSEPLPNIKRKRSNKKESSPCCDKPADNKTRPSRKKQKTQKSDHLSKFPIPNSSDTKAIHSSKKQRIQMLSLLSAFPLHNIDAIWQQPYSLGIYVPTAINKHSLDISIKHIFFETDITPLRIMLRLLMNSQAGFSYSGKYGTTCISVADCEQIIQIFKADLYSNVPSDNINPMILRSYHILTNLTKTARSLSSTHLTIPCEYGDLITAGCLYVLHIMKKSKTNSNSLEAATPSYITCPNNIYFQLNEDYLFPEIADIFNSIGTLNILDMSYYLSTNINETTCITTHITSPHTGQCLKPIVILQELILNERHSIIARAFVEKLQLAFNQKNDEFAKIMQASSLPASLSRVHTWNASTNALPREEAKMLLRFVNTILRHANLPIPGTEIPIQRGYQDKDILNALNIYINPKSLSIARTALYKSLLSVDINGKNVQVNTQAPYVKDAFHDLCTQMKNLISKCSGASTLISMGMAAFFNVAFHISSRNKTVVSISTQQIKPALFLLDNIAAAMRNQTSLVYIDHRNQHESQLAFRLMEAGIDQDSLVMLKNQISKPCHYKIPINAELLAILRRTLEISFDFPSLSIYTQTILSTHRVNHTAHDPTCHINDVVNISKLIDCALGTTKPLSTEAQIPVINIDMTMEELFVAAAKFKRTFYIYNVSKLKAALSILSYKMPSDNHQHLGLCAIPKNITKNLLSFLDHALNSELCAHKIECTALIRHLTVCRNILAHYIPTPLQIEDDAFLPHDYAIFLRQILDAALIYEKLITGQTINRPVQEQNQQYQKLRDFRIHLRDIKLLSNTTDPIAKTLCENIGEIMLYNACSFLIAERHIQKSDALIKLDKNLEFVFSLLLEHLSRLFLANPLHPTFNNMPENAYGCFLAHGQKLLSNHIPGLLSTIRSICNNANIPVPDPEHTSSIESATSTTELIKSAFSFDELYSIKRALSNLETNIHPRLRAQQIGMRIGLKALSAKIHNLYTKLLSLKSNPLAKPLFALQEYQEVKAMSDRHLNAIKTKQEQVYITSTNTLQASLFINKILDTLATGDDSFLIDTKDPDTPMTIESQFSDIVRVVGRTDLLALYRFIHYSSITDGEVFVLIPDVLERTTSHLIDSCKKHPELKFIIPNLQHAHVTVDAANRLRIHIDAMKHLLQTIIGSPDNAE